MGRGLIIIEQESSGEVWSNTHGFYVGGPGDSVPLNDADLDVIGCRTALTSSGDIAASETSLLNQLLEFHRGMAASVVRFRSVYVTDGIRGDNAFGQPAPNIFFTASLGFNGARSGVDESNADNMAPGSITLQVNRDPADYGIRRGRMFLRGCIADSDISFKGGRLLGWVNEQRRIIYNTLLQNQAAGLVGYFAPNVGTDPTDAGLGIPQYNPAPTSGQQMVKGNLNYVSPIVGFSMFGPVNRQMQRGRRRST